MHSLHDLAIYVNASDSRLQAASRPSAPSIPIVEHKRWVAGLSEFVEANSRGVRLPLIFAQYPTLSYWAVAEDIQVSESETTYRFSELRAISGYRRSDLIVVSTGNSLPDNFIRSYSIVRTPDFLMTRDRAQEPLVADDLMGLEGEPLQRMIIHRKREHFLRRAKIEEVLMRNSGRLSCEVPGCGFDFSETYGESGRGYAQVHHKIPLSSSSVPQQTRLSDLIVVCANCHVIIHRGGDCRDTENLLVLRRDTINCSDE